MGRGRDRRNVSKKAICMGVRKIQSNTLNFEGRITQENPKLKRIKAGARNIAMQMDIVGVTDEGGG